MKMTEFKPITFSLHGGEIVKTERNIIGGKGESSPRFNKVLIDKDGKEVTKRVTGHKITLPIAKEILKLVALPTKNDLWKREEAYKLIKKTPSKFEFFTYLQWAGQDPKTKKNDYYTSLYVKAA